jgi:hypothetical protein
VYTANVLCPKNGVNFALNEILENNGIEVDWLLVCLMSNGKYVVHIQDENKVNSF